MHTSQVAIIGSGPAGLSAARELVKKGYPVTVFKSQPLPGGMLRYGIPEYRLPRKVLEAQINHLERMGIEFQTGVTIGKDLTLDEIKNKGFKAILVATGASNSLKLGLSGEDSTNILSGLALLKEVNSGKAMNIGKRVVVIGGGNAAVDSARTALRLGAQEVKIIYRRSREEMPAYAEGIGAAESEGIKLEFWASPIRMITLDNRVKSIEFIRVKSGMAKSNGKAELIPIKGSEYRVEVDTVITALGEIPDTSLLSFKDGSGIFAGGDAHYRSLLSYRSHRLR